MITDFFIPVVMRHDPTILMRARSMVWFVINTIITIAVVMVLMWLSPERTEMALLAYCSLAVPLTIMYALTLGLFKATGNLSLAGNLVVFWTLLLIAFSIYITGGPMESPIRGFLLLSPILAFCLTSAKAASYWVISMMLLVLVLFGTGIMDYTFPQIMESRHLEVNHVIVWLLTITGIIILGRKMAVTIEQLGEERQIALNQINHLAEFDVLTGLFTRRQFLKRLYQLEQNHKRYQNRFALLVVDVKGFRQINEEYGLIVGDHVMVDIAQRLKKMFPSEGQVLGHLGADEWAVLLPNVSLPEEVYAIKTKLLQALNGVYQIETHQVEVSVWVEYGLYPDDASQRDALFKHVTRKMTEIKRLA